ncbi:MAG TPA: type II toxin-antitoxin system VapC family toxin [Thermoanaerobaculia bacterium]
MTARAVLDASAAVHLVMNGPHAVHLVTRLEEAAIVTTPDLFCSEAANALWKYVRAGEIDLDLALTRLEQAMGLVDGVVPQRTLAPEALVAAAKQQRSVYDMTYAVLARRSGAAVITMDRGFALALRDMEIESYCPLVKA